MKYLLLLSFCIFCGFICSAQGTYVMGNQTVSDCSAYFTDTNDGLPAGNYAHNENKVFHICIPGADSIILQFTSFCTEAGSDALTFFDGPDINSPMIGVPFSGNTTLPPVIIARSGCLTIHFVTDQSVACTGWTAAWTVSKTPPQPPVIAPLANMSCNSTAFTLTLDKPVLCDSVSAASVLVIGAYAPAISGVTPVNCIGGQTSTLQVQLSPGFVANGTYNIILNTTFRDACDSLWHLTSYQNVTVSGCPLIAGVTSPDTLVCLGECAELTAHGAGSVSGTYFYSWSNGLGTGAGPKQACPAVTTTYTVTVTDNIGTPPGIATKTVVVIPKPIFPASDTVCQTAPQIFLTATPAGGYWKGPGVQDTMLGRFNPNAAGGGIKWLKYYYNGCVDSMRKYVRPMDAGLPKAACPGSAPFNLTAVPAGGTWSGTGITNPATGTFDPAVTGIGTFTLYYANSICPYDSTFVNVANINIPADDTICTNTPVFNLSFTPQGGVWSGSGIINSFLGRYNAADANPGTNTLVYNMNGCSDTMYMTVNALWAGWDMSACPTQAPFAMPQAYPAGGYWTGPGIDSVTGMFNPGYLSGGEANTFAYYNVLGCQDDIIIYNNITRILDDTLQAFCPYDEGIVLGWDNAHNYPWGGYWTGAGILGTDSFAPDVALSGWHKLYFTNNGCTDSTMVHVYYDPHLRDSIVCDAQSPFQIMQIPVGGYWYGTGMVNFIDGIFSPQVAGIGTQTVGYVSADQCEYTMNITVDTIPILNFTGLPLDYCFKDTAFILSPNYPNGVWSGGTTTGVFNPAIAGGGLHTVSYWLGSGQCLATTSANTFIAQPLKVTTPFTDTIICYDGLVRLYASGEGGNLLQYNFVWSQNLGNGTSQLVGPPLSTVYWVTLGDGCSSQDSLSIQVNVQPQFIVTLQTDTIQCYEKPSTIKVAVSPAGVYSFNWSHSSSIHTQQISALSGHYYTVSVTESNSGCLATADTLVPSYGQLLADFITTPAGECVTSLDPDISIIDQSIGAVSGYWTYGDSKRSDYNATGSLDHSYKKAGKYKVRLYIQNEGGCSDYSEQEVCVTEATRITAPTGFSPNGDGVNDVFRIKIMGASNFQMLIYNRWGQLLFTSNNQSDGWDGKYQNQDCALDAYVYMVTYRNLELDKEETFSGNITLVR